ncbi:MAG: hypothetical protein ACRCU2_31190 [Planktothrix sp.]
MAEKEVAATYKPIIYVTTADNNTSNYKGLFNNFLQQIEAMTEDIFTRNLSSGKKVLIEPSQRVLCTIILSVFAYSIPVLPLSLGTLELIGIIVSSIGWDKVFNKISEDKDNKVLHNSSVISLEKFIQIVPYSSMPESLIFPPGHPIPNKFYRQHPLKAKKNNYIPADFYYDILLAEREAELIKILCDLGATKIEIYEEENNSKDIKFEAQAKAKVIGKAEANISKETEESQVNKQEHSYIAKPWHPKLKDEFDSSKYKWLSYEPIWESIVYGRITNGQLRANIELTTNLSKEGMIGIIGTEGLLEEIWGVSVSSLGSKLVIKKRKFSIEFAGKEESKSAKPRK